MSSAHISLPADAYRTEAAFESEIDSVFRRTWACVGRSEHVAEPGAYYATDVAGQNVVVVRDHDGELRAFHNVCRHRGALLCDAGTGTLKRAIKCPYHAWAYGLDGQLIGTPNVRPDEIDRSQYRLHRMPVAEWEGTLFVDLGGQGGSFEDYIASHDDDPRALERFNAGDLRIARTTTREVAANWKIVVENYRECLHCPTVHPELVDMIPAYRSGGIAEAEPRADYGVGIKDGAVALTLSGTTTIPPLPGITEEESRSVYGAYLFPNSMVDVQGNYATLTTLLPRGANCTVVVTDYLLPPDVIADPAMESGLEQLMQFMELVVDQDSVVAERAQQGIGSRAFDHGVYPEKDAALHAFNERYRALVAGTT
jgi:Rieske 2Fe-2S family protein